MSQVQLDTLLKKQTTVIFSPTEMRSIDQAAHLIALANGRGGMLVMGMASAEKVTGLADAATVRDRLMQVALECDPPLIMDSPAIIQVQEQSVLLVKIPPDLPHVYNYDGRYLIWDKDGIKPLRGHTLRQLIFARGESGFEHTLVPGATKNAINWEMVASYTRSTEGLRHLSPEEALIKRGCLKEEAGELYPTYAGILLFGLDLQRWLPDAGITVARYTGLQMSDAFLRADIQGTLPEQARKAEAFILENIHRGVALEGLQRKDDYLYPIAAVREVIVNALAHRDYSVRGDHIRLLLFANRLECYSPGLLPGHVTVDNIQDERFSRNAAMVQVLFDMGFIERLGYGINRIIRTVAEAGLPEPELTESAAGFKITIYNNTSSNTQQHSALLRTWLEMGLNERQISALGFMADHGRITNADYQDLCPDVSPETLRRDLSDLVKRDLLLRIGEKRATFYILK
ncbi:MAG: ATP-binding protein [Chloroflexota bacterium]